MLEAKEKIHVSDELLFTFSRKKNR